MVVSMHDMVMNIYDMVVSMRDMVMSYMICDRCVTNYKRNCYDNF